MRDGGWTPARTTMGYLLLAGAIGCEIVATTCLKCSEGFTQFGWSLLTVVFYIACYVCLSRALLTVDLSVAYATWCAVGIVATTVIAVLAFGEQLNTASVIGIILCVAGVVLLNLNTAGH